MPLCNSLLALNSSGIPLLKETSLSLNVLKFSLTLLCFPPLYILEGHICLVVKYSPTESRSVLQVSYHTTQKGLLFVYYSYDWLADHTWCCRLNDNLAGNPTLKKCYSYKKWTKTEKLFLSALCVPERCMVKISPYCRTITKLRLCSLVMQPILEDEPEAQMSFSKCYYSVIYTRNIVRKSLESIEPLRYTSEFIFPSSLSNSRWISSK